MTHVYQGTATVETTSIPTDSIGTAAGLLLQCGSRQFTFTDSATGTAPSWLQVT